MQTKVVIKNFLLLILFIFVICIKNVKSESIIEIDNPKFTEKGLDNKIYEIKAAKGFKSNQELKLISVEGKFKSENGVWIYLEAEYGNFSEELNKIKLENNVVFYTDNKESFKSDFAEFDMENDIIELKRNVEHSSKLGRIIADYSKIQNINNVIYEGKVETKLNIKN